MMKLLVRVSGCPNCEQVKNWLKENPVDGIEFVNADENLDYCRKHNIRSVPCLVNETEDKFYCNAMAIIEELRRIKDAADGK